jgi:hypothetical protein
VLPILDDAIIDSEDILLFTYAVSKSFGNLHDLYDVLTTYSRLLPAQAVKHAILTLAAHELPEPLFGERAVSHFLKVISVLITQGVSTAEDGDLMPYSLTSLLFACVDEYIRGARQPLAWRPYFTGNLLRPLTSIASSNWEDPRAYFEFTDVGLGNDHSSRLRSAFALLGQRDKGAWQKSLSTAIFFLREIEMKNEQSINIRWMQEFLVAMRRQRSF